MLITAAGNHLSSYTFLPNLCGRPGPDMTSIRVAEPRETTFYSITFYIVCNWNYLIAKQVNWHVYC